MHRLTRIKQLSHTYLVYPSAVHTRFEHSLGILHIADRMCGGFRIDGKRREIIRCAALLHDVGHGPFSHLFENILARINGDKFVHESITKAIIEFDPEIRGILEGKYIPANGADPVPDIFSSVLSIFDKEKESTDEVAKAIISGQIDADKMDYLRRDSHHTGSTYGIFDLERILSTLRLHSEVKGKEYPVILEKGLPALESFRLARYSLYTQVYQHHARLIADRMFLRSLEIAIFEEKAIPASTFKFEKRKERQFIKEYMKHDDHSIYELVLSKCKPAGFAFKIMDDLKNRRLFKRCADREVGKLPVHLMMTLEKDKGAVKDLEARIAKAARVPAELVIVLLDSEESGLKSYGSFGKTVKAGELPMLCIGKDRKIGPVEDRTSITSREASKKLYVFTKADLKSRVKAACEELIG